MSTTAILSLRRFSYAYPGAEDFILKDINLDVYPGQCHCLSGPTGCGKTTLLMAVRGLLPSGRRGGELVINAGSGARAATAAGIVLQNPQLQLMGVGLGADVAFGLENHCIPEGQMAQRVRHALAQAGLQRALDTPVLDLSMGQQYRACLAGALVMSPAIVLLDEPAAQLDPQGLAQLTRVIANLKLAGKAVLVCDHRPAILCDVIDHYWHLDQNGKLGAGGVSGLSSPGAARGTYPVEHTAPVGGPSESDDHCPGDDEPVVIRVHRLALP